MGEGHTINVRDKFRRFIDTSPVMMCLLDREFNGIYFNQEWLSFTGRAEWELFGSQWLGYIHPLDKDRCIEVFRESLEKQQGFDVEFRIQRAGGFFSHVRNTGIPQISEDGQLEEYIITAVDISARKAAESAMRAGEIRARAMFAGSVGNAAIIDRAGHITMMNDAWLEFAREHSGTLAAVGAGVNYLEVCQRAMERGSQDAAKAHNGIIEVLNGMLPKFGFEYLCPIGSEEACFEMVVHPLRCPGGGAIITHLNVTNWRRAQREARSLFQELTHLSRVAALNDLTVSFIRELEVHYGKISVANNPGKGVTFSVALPVFGRESL